MVCFLGLFALEAQLKHVYFIVRMPNSHVSNYATQPKHEPHTRGQAQKYVTD